MQIKNTPHHTIRYASDWICSVKRTTHFILIVVLSTLIIGLSADVAPGINRIAQGYNIIIGNPMEKGMGDPGFLSPIFSTGNYSEGSHCSLNGKTYVSFNGVTCHSCISCNSDWEFSEYHGIQSYSSKLSKSVGASAKFGPFQFGASKSYQTVHMNTIEKQSIMTNAEIQCVVTCAVLNYGDFPEFSTGFINKIYQMPLLYTKNTSDTDWFYDFITNGFGTHYIQSMQIGGRIGQYSATTYYKYDTFYSSSYSVSLSAEYLAANSSAGLSLSSNKQQQQSKMWSAYSSGHSAFSYGSTIPSSAYPGDITQWQSSLFSNNAPIYISLNELDNLLKPEHWTRYKINNESLSKKQYALNQAIDDYCNQFVARNPTIDSIYCHHLPSNNAAPVRSVFKGMYYAVTGYVNPYTLAMNCDPNYTPVNWLRWNYDYAYMCLETSARVNNSLYYDPMGYFGGIYTMACRDTSNPCTAYIACKLTSDSKTEDGVNPFTQRCSCPNGYFSNRFKQSRASKNGLYYPSYWCFKSTKEHAFGVLAGFFQTGRWEINNQFTKALECPVGSQEYHVMQWKCDNVKDKQCNLYICLTNAWH
eukprot:1044854_1